MDPLLSLLLIPAGPLGLLAAAELLDRIAPRFARERLVPFLSDLINSPEEG